MQERYRTLIIIPAIIIAAIAVYVKGMSGPFQFDDERDIVYRPEVVQGAIAAAQSSPYRALTYATYAVDWKLGGGSPKSFRITNLAIHIAVSLFLFLVIYSIFPLEKYREPASAIGALGFALHPICVASVNYISGRAGLLSALGGLLMIWMWEGKKFKGRWALLIMLEAFALTAKEDAVIFPVLLAAFSIIKRRKDFKELVLPLLVAVLYGVLRVFSHPVVMSEPGREISLASHLAMQPYMYCRALLSWLWPIGLSLDHHPASISGISDVRIWLCSFVIVVLVLLAASAIGWGNKSAGISATWFILALAPAVMIPLADPIAENRWYFAMAGLSILVAGAVKWVTNRKRAMGLGFGAIYLLGLFSMAYNRVDISSNPSSLWAQSVKLYPQSARPWSNYAQARFRDGAVQSAAFAAQQALSVEKDDSAAWNTLGLSLKNMGKYDDALEAYRQAVFYDKNFFVAYTNQANILAATGRLAEAESSYREALKIVPEDPDANYGFAWVLVQTDRKDEAISHLKIILDKTEDEQARQLLNKLISEK